uniref:40S ribosomal protein S11 n=1 Tax=Haemonchus contortus TaxID=6289 RepID=A0A7I4Z6T0_HAECO
LQRRHCSLLSGIPAHLRRTLKCRRNTSVKVVYSPKRCGPNPLQLDYVGKRPRIGDIVPLKITLFDQFWPDTAAFCRLFFRFFNGCRRTWNQFSRKLSTYFTFFKVDFLLK